MRILWTAPLCLTLAACGGSGGETPVVITPPAAPTTPTTPTSPPTGGAQTGTQMRSAANGLLTTYANPVSFTAISSIPSSLTATYNGYAYGNLANTSDGITNTLMGQLAMTVSLTSNAATVTGTISNVTDDADNALAGQLSLLSGSLDRAGDPNADATFGAGFLGTLTDTANRDLTVGGQLQGDFLGSNQAAIGGNLLGTVTVSGAIQQINGGFIAER